MKIKCNFKKKTKFELSQLAHQRLALSYRDRASTPKNLAFNNYHIFCLNTQKELNRILTKPERKKLFSWWQTYRTKGEASAFPEFK